MSSTQDDVQQLVAAAYFLRDQPKAEAHYYSRVIAEVAGRMLAAPTASAQEPDELCDNCGLGHPSSNCIYKPAQDAHQPCNYLSTVMQHTGDGTPVEFCPECGTNRLVAQPETWKVLPSPLRVTGEMLHQAFPEIPGEKWPLPAARKAVWERFAERVNARLAAQVDESPKTHAKSPDEIDDLHKQVDAQVGGTVSDHVCPSCLGTPSKSVVAFMNTGEDWTQHYQQEVDFQCQVCGATGKVSDDVNRRYYAGRLHRHVRAQRGETMRDAAIRLGVTVPQLSAWELGYADLPTGEPIQEVKE